MALLLVYLFSALIISFACSIVEAILLSVPMSYLRSTRDKAAEGMLALKSDIDKPLSSILSLNTIAHTVGAAGVGAQANIVFGEAYFGIVSAVLTVLILVLTEIIPKTLGANYSKELLGVAVKLIKGMMFLTYPIVILSSYLTRMLSRDKKGFSTSREEISILASIGKQEGLLEDNENRIIQNLIRLKYLRIEDIMTPRIVMVCADEEMTLKEFLLNKEYLHFSRILIYSETRDNITGYVLREQLLENLAEDKFVLKLKDQKRAIHLLSERVTVYAAWDKLLASREHIALVADEYGEVCGLVTLEDIIETLLGFEIIDEKDKVVDMRQYAKDRWKARQKKYNIIQEKDS